MATLYVLAVIETIGLLLAKFLGFNNEAIIYTIVGMMIVTFGYIIENLLADKKTFPHRRKIIVLAIFGLVLLVYWVFNFI